MAVVLEKSEWELKCDRFYRNFEEVPQESFRFRKDTWGRVALADNTELELLHGSQFRDAGLLPNEELMSDMAFYTSRAEESSTFPTFSESLYHLAEIKQSLDQEGAIEVDNVLEGAAQAIHHIYQARVRAEVKRLNNNIFWPGPLHVLMRYSPRVGEAHNYFGRLAGFYASRVSDSRFRIRPKVYDETGIIRRPLENSVRNLWREVR